MGTLFFPITGTAFLRNPHHHTANVLPETLDDERTTKVVDGVLNVVVDLSGID